MNPSIEQIIKMYLMENGYDGLYNSEDECACEIANLLPCDCPHGDHCKAGYKCKPPDGYEDEYCIGQEKEM